MDYKTLNENNRKKIKSIISSDNEMSWEDPRFFYEVAGDFPRIRETSYDKSIITQLTALKEHYRSYDFIRTNKESFIEKLDDLITEIRSKSKYWYGLDIYQVRTCIDIQKACVMRGAGGAGKTHFVMRLEEELATRKISHLCIYGKFEKTLQRIDFEEIDTISIDNRFVFIIDAINEMKNDAQIELCKRLKKLICNKGLQVLITYRNNTIDNTVQCLLDNLSNYNYSFAGVSYESAIENMLKLGIPDVYKYEDILFSNNALLLSNLMAILNSKIITKDERNNIASVTHILENGGIKERCGKNVWNDTKVIAKWMLENESHTVPVEVLYSMIYDPGYYISIMEQYGFLSVFSYDGKTNIYYSSETLMDYLIARSMLGPLGKLSYKKGIEYIKQKTEAIPSIKEALIIALFDKYKNSYQELKTILIDTDLINEFTPDVLIKIKFAPCDIPLFLNCFKITEPLQWLLDIGGYTDKPFNCTNYLNDYLFNNKKAQIELTNLLSGKHFYSNVIGRLKNLIYFIAVNGAEDNRVSEACFFAMWCSAAPNRTVRHLAMKLLFDVASRNDKLRHRLTEILPYIVDPYIIESIIYTLAYCDPGLKEDTKECFKQLIHNKSFHYARCLKRIALYLGDPHSYITWDKKNLYEEDGSKLVSEKFQRLLSTVDIMDKYLLPFRYWAHNDFREFDLFIDASKQAITNLNYDLNNNYKCLRNHYECRNSHYFKEYLFKLHGIDRCSSLDCKALASSYEKAAQTVFALFDENLYDKRRFDNDFQDSKFRKLVDVSTDYFMGSIMCNYYKNDFHCYDGEDYWGFELYDPIPYFDSEEINITSPIPVLNSTIEEVGTRLVTRIELPENKYSKWHDDSSITERNLLNLIEPIMIQNEEWVLLAGSFSPVEIKQNEKMWEDKYILYCCTSSDRSLTGMGDRYLTIEIPEYTGNLNYYYMCNETPEFCKDIRNITTTDEFDDSTLVLPPSDLINYFNLTPNYREMSWIDQNGRAIILCDNCKKSYYRDCAKELVLIRKESLDEYLRYNAIKLFSFTERLIKNKGYSNESCFHYEIQNGIITKRYKNNPRGDNEYKPDASDEECINCPYNLYEKKLENRAETEKSLDEFIKMMNKYAPSDWAE